MRDSAPPETYFGGGSGGWLRFVGFHERRVLPKAGLKGLEEGGRGVWRIIEVSGQDDGGVPQRRRVAEGLLETRFVETLGRRISCSGSGEPIVGEVVDHRVSRTDRRGRVQQPALGQEVRLSWPHQL